MNMTPWMVIMWANIRIAIPDIKDDLNALTVD
jgi:hypothetical protein